MNENTLEMSRTTETIHEKIREAAYFRWLDRGCAPGDDWADWLAAEHRLLASLETSPAGHVNPDAIVPKFSIQATLAAHSSDPTHRFHGTGVAHDNRTNVILDGAPQRVRSRRQEGSRRPQQKRTR